MLQMDKAALLAEVITHVKKLKTSAARIRSHCAVPADADDVAVELDSWCRPRTRRRRPRHRPTAAASS